MLPPNLMLLAALGATAAAPPAPDTGAPLSVMSFNLRYATANDGDDAWPRRRGLLFAVVREARPDLIGTQEGLADQLDELRAGLGDGWAQVGVGRDDGRRAGEFAAILYRTERLERVEDGTFWLSDTPDVPGSATWGNRVTRICTWARFTDRASGTRFRVVNCHFDHESQPSRERSAALLLERVRAFGAEPVIVTGDLNAGETNPAVRSLLTALRDSYRMLHPQDSVVGTFHGFRGDSTGEKIDVVLATPDVTPLTAAIVRTALGGRYPSDHFPVTALLRLPPPPEPEPPVEAEDLLAEIVISATRAERRVRDEPLRVEVVDAEEIAEKVAMTPGDVAMLLAETGGLRVQNTAPAVGRSNVRVQGVLGRYTQVLTDGLPQYGLAGALDIGQIPPLDLARVEVIKGTGTALYGGAALGGVVNLVARRPDGRRELLVNGTTQGGADAVLWWAGRSQWSLLSSNHYQPQRDRDGDGWADMPGYERFTLRPRLHVGEGTPRSLTATAGVMVETRTGGTMPGDTVPDGTAYVDRLRTLHLDLAASGRWVTASGWLLGARASAMRRSQEHELGSPARVEPGIRTTALLEATASRIADRMQWLVGLAVQRDGWDADSTPDFSYTHTVPGVFGQVEWDATSVLALAASARVDHHDAYGTFLSPRLSLLARLGGPWTARVSAGTGFFGPTPFIEETDNVGVRPFTGPLDVAAERGASASVDINGTLGGIEVSGTVFWTGISDQVYAQEVHPPCLPPGGCSFLQHGSSAGPARSAGFDALARWRHGPWQATLSYTIVDATREQTVDQREAVPLTPLQQAGIVAAWEGERTRIGWELYAVGEQALEENPYRMVSAPFALTGVLVQHRIGQAQLFVNFENLTDVRMTRWQPLVRPDYDWLRGWTTDVWAPLEGRVINGGVRVGF